VSPLHDLTIMIRGSMTIAKLALADQGTTAEFAVTFRPGAFTVLQKGKHIYVNVI
jgi:hypothetical protein